MLPTLSQSLLETKIFQPFWGVLLEFLVCIGDERRQDAFSLPWACTPCWSGQLVPGKRTVNSVTGQPLWTDDEAGFKLPSSGDALVVQLPGLHAFTAVAQVPSLVSTLPPGSIPGQHASPTHLPKNSGESLYLSLNFVENLKLPLKTVFKKLIVALSCWRVIKKLNFFLSIFLYFLMVFVRTFCFYCIEARKPFQFF